MTSLIPMATFTDKGLSVPTEDAIKAGVWAVFQAALGGRLNQSDTTPQGQIVTALTAAMGEANNQLLEYVNLTDPARSSGRMQDGIGALSFIERIAAEATVVTAQCIGAVGTLIPRGSLARATDGTLYQSLGDATIPSTGTIDVVFQAVQTGPIQCPANSLTQIYKTSSGWDTINNSAPGVPGRDAETPAEFEARRSKSVAINANGITSAIKGALLGVSGVVDAYVTDNDTSASVVKGGVTIPAKSLYACVTGGTDADVAAALFTKKVPGCGFTGTTTITVQDTGNGYSTPYPEYAISFQRASNLPIYFAIVLSDNGLVPANAEEQIQNAIISAFSGGDGGSRARIGSTTYALRFASVISALGSWAQLISIKVGTTSTPTGAEVLANIDQFPVTAASNIVVSLA